MSQKSFRRVGVKMSLWKRCLVWGLPGMVGLGILGYFVGRSAIEGYLRSDRFRKFVGEKVGVTLRSECVVAPLQLTDLNLYTESFEAKGGVGAPFGSLELRQLRAQLSLRRFFEKVWQVEEIEVQRLTVRLGGDRVETGGVEVAGGGSGGGDGGGGKSSSGGWLPNRVEIGLAIVKDTNIEWEGGAMRHTVIRAEPDGGAWKIVGRGGKVESGGLPDLEMQGLAVIYRAPSIFVNQAEFRQGGLGSVKVTGEINLEDRVDLSVGLKDLNMEPFLSPDWRVRLKGQISGDVKVRGTMPMGKAGPEIGGTVRVEGGQLTALPVLDKIALFTNTQQFRRLSLSQASANFKQLGGRLEVTQFVAESRGLIRIEGEFTVEKEMIDGRFQVGVTPTSLVFIPGSQEKVFVESRGGYVWTSLKLTGPVNQPKEDLTGRLAKALGDSAVEAVVDGAKDPVKKGGEVIKGILDLVFPR